MTIMKILFLGDIVGQPGMDMVRSAVALVNMKRVDESLPLFRKVFALDANWKTLTPRLVGVGLLADDKDALAKILK